MALFKYQVMTGCVVTLFYSCNPPSACIYARITFCSFCTTGMLLELRYIRSNGMYSIWQCTFVASKYIRSARQFK